MAKLPRRSRPTGPFDLLYSINIPLIILDLHQLKILTVNEAGQELLGQSQSQLRGMGFLKLAFTEDHRRVTSVFEIFRESPKTVSMTEPNISLRRKSGRRIHVNLVMTRHNFRGRDYLIVNLQDLTEVRREQKRREESLRELSHLSKLADIGRLAAGVAHELNNPLMIIQGFAENLDLLFDTPPIDPNDCKIQMAEILRASDRMARIISKMTRIVRNDDLQMVVVDLQEIVQDVMRLIRPQIMADSVDLQIDFQGQNLIKCDPNQVEQILINIINNALHALKELPNERLLKMSGTQQEGLVRLEIFNNGPEIPSEIRDRIMSPFFTTKEVGKGTGLGLTLSHGIMRAHGGDLTFESSERGTAFTLSFPAQSIQEVTRPINDLKILVLDDEPAAVEILSNKLRIFGYKVIGTTDPFEALEILKANPDIVAVFTDLHMPKMDGRNFIRAARGIGADRFLVFGITGYSPSRTTEMELRRVGIDGFLSKPIEVNAFASVVRQIEAFVELKTGQNQAA